MLTTVQSGRSPGVTSRHEPPASSLTCTSPSSVPAHSKPCRSGDSASANTVHQYSAPIFSVVISPELRSLSGSLRVRSELTGSQVCPWSLEAKMRLPAM